jgi:hypothetical protein
MFIWYEVREDALIIASAAAAGYLLYSLCEPGHIVPAHSGNDQERESEREAVRSHSFPRCALLRVRRFWADPLALLPHSLPDGRRRTVARAHHPEAPRRARVPLLMPRCG